MVGVVVLDVAGGVGADSFRFSTGNGMELRSDLHFAEQQTPQKELQTYPYSLADEPLSDASTSTPVTVEP